MISDIPFATIEQAEHYANELQASAGGARTKWDQNNTPVSQHGSWVVVLNFGMLFVWHSHELPEERDPDTFVLYDAGKIQPEEL